MGGIAISRQPLADSNQQENVISSEISLLTETESRKPKANSQL